MVKNWGALWAAAVLVLMACAGTWIEYTAHAHCDKSGAPCQYEANQKNERLIGDVAGNATSMVAALKSNEAIITLVATAFSALSAVAVAIFTYVLARKTASLYEATAGLETAARQQVQDTKALLLATQQSADAASKSADAAEYAIKDKDVPALAVEIDPHGLVAAHASGRWLLANQSAKVWADCKIKNISGFPAVVMEVFISAEMRADRPCAFPFPPPQQNPLVTFALAPGAPPKVLEVGYPSGLKPPSEERAAEQAWVSVQVRYRDIFFAQYLSNFCFVFDAERVEFVAKSQRREIAHRRLLDREFEIAEQRDS